MSASPNITSLYFKDTRFASLMAKRIFNVLLIANPYDAFMLEEDGRIEEKMVNEYTALSLHYPPRFKQVVTLEEALEQLESMTYDLIICMLGTGETDNFETGRVIKSLYPKIPIVVLTPFSHGIGSRIAREDLNAFDYVFCWLGNTDLLLSIIKLIEDRMNLEQDVSEVGVQLILLVEDGIRFYSSILPNLYKFVLQQSQEFSTEALNDHERMLRMRGRPKIVLARNFQEASYLYHRYQKHVLGVITDVRFPMKAGEEKEKLAGIHLCEEIHQCDPFLPLIIQSSENTNAIYAIKFGASFIDKSSKKMDVDLRTIVSLRFGFGDFIFRNPKTGEEIARVHNLKELQNILFALPVESLLYHLGRNDISRWLYSRAMFPIADFVRSIACESSEDCDLFRKQIFESIVKYRKMKNQGIVAVFQRDRFDKYSNFARIGEGSLGGKGRGLAFMDIMLKRHFESEHIDKAEVVIPRTVVLCTDLFDEFMEQNNLYAVALSDADDVTILHHFLQAKLPRKLVEDFFSFSDAVTSPIAVRSSSLLEDAHYQPFAGIYNTYMIPYLDDRKAMARMLSNAIKGVYASVFFKDSKAYMQATSNVIDQEKMAVILQEVVGQPHGERYYPTISGVGRSLNYYPIGDEQAEEGIVNLALGLGKYIVDGGKTLRFSPYHPTKVLQTSELNLALKETQTQFYALDLKDFGDRFSFDDGFNLLTLPVKAAEEDGSLRYIASTYDSYDEVLRDGIYPGGRKVLTFSSILQHGSFPLADILKKVLKLGQEAMRRPVEIEFAVNLQQGNKGNGTFYLLQVRPIVDSKSELIEDLSAIADEKLLLKSEHSLGHGILDNLYDVIYVKTDMYKPANNAEIAVEIETLNRQFLAESRSCILIGPGRWGSSDPWLGIPVKWAHISSAKVIVEAGLTNYRIEPSQGTHFFQNLTSLEVGYFTINDYMGDGLYRQNYLNAHPAARDMKFIRWVHFDQPLIVKMDGKKKKGVVLMPGE